MENSLTQRSAVVPHLLHILLGLSDFYLFILTQLNPLVGSEGSIQRPASRSISITYHSVCQVYPDIKLYM